MRRWGVLGLVVLVVSAAEVVAGPLAGPGAAGQGRFASGGIGLTQAEWETIQGPGEVWQNYVTYGDGRYYVQFADGAVSFIELGWEDQGGIDTASAVTEVESLLPEDAGFVETFFAPPTGGGPTGLLLDRYQSTSLPDRYPAATNPTHRQHRRHLPGSPAPDRFEPVITRASIAIGTDLPG